MKTRKIIQELLIAGIFIAPLLYFSYLWNSLPEIIPIHFDIKGNPDDYGAKNSFAIILGGIYIGLYVFLKYIPRIYRHNSFTQTDETFYKFRLILALFLATLGFIIIYSTQTGKTNISLIGISVAFLLSIFGNYMGSVRPNHFIANKFFWSNQDEFTWKKMQHFIARLWFFSGIALVLIIILLPKDFQLYGLFAGLISMMVLIPAIYSLRLKLKYKNAVHKTETSTVSAEVKTNKKLNSENWIGLFYFNRNDKRLLVPKRVSGMGWTLNFGNPISYILIIFIILFIIIF